MAAYIESFEADIRADIQRESATLLRDLEEGGEEEVVEDTGEEEDEEILVIGDESSEDEFEIDDYWDDY